MILALWLIVVVLTCKPRVSGDDPVLDLAEGRHNM